MLSTPADTRRLTELASVTLAAEKLLNVAGFVTLVTNSTKGVPATEQEVVCVNNVPVVPKAWILLVLKFNVPV
jgi:hypothetical protein